jgi:hypothetical protein
MNSSGELVVETSRAPNGPHIGLGIENPPISSEELRTPPRIVRELYENLGVSPNSPIISQLPETSITYTIPLYHFSSTSNNITIVPDK